MPAAAAKHEPTDQGDVVAPANGSAASRTMGCGSDNRFVARNAADANIQETAEGQSGKEQRGFQKLVQSACLRSSFVGSIEAQQIAL